ncbi:MAG TPA: EF-hand domain-containing protein [Methylophilaceae bacterium]|jgi:Ca2+-binding EF-hand superfamily protein
MKIQLKNVVLVASVLLSTSAFADAMFSTGGYNHELHKMDMMKMLDADGNHMVSKAEADSFYSSLFDALDTDKDGTIDAKEWVGTKGNQSISLATGGFSRELRTMAMMKLVDTDSDHTVSKEEFLKLNETQFTAMDKSGDGQLDPQEWLAKQTGNKK